MGDSTTMEQESQNEKKRDRVTFQKCATLLALTCMGDSTHISNHSPSKERNLSDDLKCQNSINSENISLTIYLSITLDFMDDNHCVHVYVTTQTQDLLRCQILVQVCVYHGGKTLQNYTPTAA